MNTRRPKSFALQSVDVDKIAIERRRFIKLAWAYRKDGQTTRQLWCLALARQYRRVIFDNTVPAR